MKSNSFQCIPSANYPIFLNSWTSSFNFIKQSEVLSLLCNINMSISPFLHFNSLVVIGLESLNKKTNREDNVTHLERFVVLLYDRTNASVGVNTTRDALLQHEELFYKQGELFFWIFVDIKGYFHLRKKSENAKCEITNACAIYCTSTFDWQDFTIFHFTAKKISLRLGVKILDFHQILQRNSNQLSHEIAWNRK